jgi:hypothetical protein
MASIRGKIRDRTDRRYARLPLSERRVRENRMHGSMRRRQATQDQSA